MATKLCKDCMHCRPQVYGGKEFHECLRPVGTSPVTGGPKLHRWTYCSIQRDNNWYWSLVFNTCGKRARFFQPKLDEPARRIDDSIDEYLS